MLNAVSSSSPYPGSPVFSTFAKQLPPPAWPKPPAPVVEDRFLDPKYNLGGKQALGWFMSGFTLAMAGRWAWKGMLPQNMAKAEKQVGSFETNNILRSDPSKRDELNIAQAFLGPLDSIYRLAHLDPSHRKTLLAYLGSGMIGYVSGGVAQGAQETWVRREESRIRARLINGMQDVVAQSIRNKHEFDNRFREETRVKLAQLLEKHGLPGSEGLVQDIPQMPLVESPDMLRRYFYQPTSRRVMFGLDASLNQHRIQPDDPMQRVRLQKGILMTLGALTGWAIHSLVTLMKAPVKAALFEGDKVLYETIHIKDKEAWWVNGMKSPRNLMLMFGFFGISALAKAGQLFIEGLREIEVTRLNAQTELSYQTHNWLSQDPAFHEIAEREAVRNDVQQLEKDLPLLRQNPKLLRERIQAILKNVGRNSAPPYFPMTPLVGLVEARA